MSKDTIRLDHLIRIAEDVPWETFEAMPDGRLLIQDRAQTLIPEEEGVSPLLWVFEMRVGLHFERPMQAIMSCGQFIRMRNAEQWQGHNVPLFKLDPEQPGKCLYYYYNQINHRIGSWRPLPSHQADTTTVWLGPGQTVIGSGGGGGGTYKKFGLAGSTKI